jgi:hypothetical protein
MKRIFTLVLSLIFIYTSGAYAQTTIVEWNFDDGNATADVAIPANTTKTLTSINPGTITYTVSDFGLGARVTGWNGSPKYWEVEFSTIGYENITVSSNQRSSSTGPRDFSLQYRIGSGGTWNTIRSLTLADNWTSAVVNNELLPAAANDQSSVYLRWEKTSNITVGGSSPVTPFSSSNIDNILIEGQELGTTAFVALSANSPTAGTLITNSLNNVLYTLEAAATNNSANLVGLSAPTSGSYISSNLADTNPFKLWFSSDATFNASEDIQLDAAPAVGSGETINFSFDQAIAQNATGYFFITVDIGEDVGVGNTIGIAPVSLSLVSFNPYVYKTGTDLLPASSLQQLDCIDINSDLSDTGNQPAGANISSLATSPVDAVKVMEFYVFDQGTCDNLPTEVLNVRIEPSVDNTALWSESIGGAVLQLTDDFSTVEIPIASVTVTDEYMDLTFAPNVFIVADGAFPTAELFIYLSTTGLTDGATLGFAIYENHGFVAAPGGSQFEEMFSFGDVVSNPFSIEVIATQLAYGAQPVNTGVGSTMQPVVLDAVDANGNLDVDFSNQVMLSSSGTIQMEPLSVNAQNGQATFSNIVHTEPGSALQLTATATGLTSAVSDPFDVFILNQNFTNCPPAGWQRILIDGNNWQCANGYEYITGIGGAAEGTDAWLIAPSRNFNLFATPVLSFDSYTTGTDVSYPAIEVLYSSDYSGVGNPYLATWNSLSFSASPENSGMWTSSGLIDLSMLTGVNYIAYHYTSSGNTAGTATEWRIDNVLITNDGCMAPDVPASNLTFSGIENDAMTLTWEKGNGAGRIGVVRAGAAVDAAPVSGTEYTANANYGDPLSELGSGNYVVYTGSGDSVRITGLSPNTAYHFAVYDYNCTGASINYAATAATAIQNTLDPDGSDIIAQAGYTYTNDIDYLPYDRLSSLTLAETIGVFGFTIRDGGSAASDADALPTTLTAISFYVDAAESAPSSPIRAAALYNSTTLVAEQLFTGNDILAFTGLSVDVLDDQSLDLELRVTFMDEVVDNEQLQFTIIGAEAAPAGSQFAEADAGGAQSATAGGENTIRVTADDPLAGDELVFVQVPVFSLPIDQDFTVEVAAIDARGSRDRDVALTIATTTGTGSLTSPGGLQRTTAGGTALWNDLQYDTEENNVVFTVSDDAGLLDAISTEPLSAKPLLALFTFTGATGNEIEYAPDFQSADVFVDNIRRGPGVEPAALADAFNTRNWSGTENNEDYLELIIIPDNGTSIDISSIVLDHRRSESGPNTVVVRTDAGGDNFESQIGGFFTNNPTNWNRNTLVNFGSDIVNETNTVRIRIYAYNSTSDLGTWAIDNIEINGTVTDVGAPQFLPDYPLAINNTASGFDLLVSVDEPGTVFYVITATGDPAPMAADIISGSVGVASGSIEAAMDSTEYSTTIASLLSASGYDVYFALQDALGNATADADIISLINVRTSDISSTIDPPVAQVPGGMLDGTSTAAVPVFRFSISDDGATDGLPTKVTKLRIEKVSMPNAADWSANIDSVSFAFAGTMANIPIEALSITSDSIVAWFDSANFQIADGTAEEIVMSIYLNESELEDNVAFQFEIDGGAGKNATSMVGTQFADPVSAGVQSNVFNLNIGAIRLLFTAHPVLVDVSTDFQIDVAAVDANGNIDVDETSNVELLVGTGSGNLSAVSTLTRALVNGVASWSDVQYDANDELFSIVASSATLVNDTTGLISVGLPQNLIVLGGQTLTVDAPVTSITGYVQIDAGGELILTSGSLLQVGGNFTNNGTYTDQGGTLEFNGSALPDTLNGTSPTRFYNLTITNSAGVVNELTANLVNTLKLNDGALFDTDGENNDRNFTLLSTASNTARIATLETGAVLSGEIIMQRYIADGPQGYRFLATPIKNQTLGSWQDDLAIQGVAERFSSAWPNAYYYREPVGVENNGGADGWTPFNSFSNPIPVGRGQEVYIWQRYLNKGTGITVDNKGVPFTRDDDAGDGDDDYYYDLSKTLTAYDGGGWNLLANVYPSEIDWNLVGKTDILGSAYYVWNPDIQNYSTYNSVGGITDASRYIASGQAFFVKALDQSTSEVWVNENVKADVGGYTYLRVASREAELSKIKLKLTSSTNQWDETLIAFDAQMRDDFEPLIDAQKFAAGWVNMSTMVGDKSLAINAMGELRGVKRIPLRLETYTYGAHTLTVSEWQQMDPMSNLRLVDHFLGKSTTLSEDMTYQFTVTEKIPDTFADGRLELVLATPVVLALPSEKAKENEPVAMPVKMSKLADVHVARLVFEWDAEAFSYIGIDDMAIDGASMHNFDLSLAHQGRIIFSWQGSDEALLALPDESKIFSLRLQPTGTGLSTDFALNEHQSYLTGLGDIDIPLHAAPGFIEFLEKYAIGGKVLTARGEELPEAQVQATGGEQYVAVTDGTGTFELQVYGNGQFTLSAQQNMNTSANASVSVLDVIKTRRHLLQKMMLADPLAHIAADVDVSKDISEADLLEIQQVILGSRANFSTGEHWLLLPNGQDLSANPFSYATERVVMVDDGNAQIDFTGLKLGDVDFSWSTLATPAPQDAWELAFDATPVAGGNLEVVVEASTEHSLSGYQFTLTWNPEAMQLTDFENEMEDQLVNTDQVDFGRLSVVWDESEGISKFFEEGAHLFRLHFSPVNSSESLNLEVSNELTQALAYNESLGALRVQAAQLVLGVEETLGKKLLLFQNVPNPFMATTEVPFFLPQSGAVRFTIINMLGEIIYDKEADFDAGNNTFFWNRNESIIKPSPGVYLYQIEVHGEKALRKMVIK